MFLLKYTSMQVESHWQILTVQDILEEYGINPVIFVIWHFIRATLWMTTEDSLLTSLYSHNDQPYSWRFPSYNLAHTIPLNP